MHYRKLVQNVPQFLQSFNPDRKFQSLSGKIPKAGLRTGKAVFIGISILNLFTFSVRQPIGIAVEARSQQIALGNWQGASFPVENFQTYTSPFGLRQAPDGSYTEEYHRGLDMAAPEGSYVRNWWNGKVVEVSDDSACGTSVVVESGQWEHIYCHMQGHVESANGGRYMIDREGGIQIWEGQMVPAGVRIGRVGMTGRTTGPHLHWGLKYGGQWVDPALVLRAMYAEQSGQGRVSRK
jgi:murein DD-endopeptidase MepM/ murein hydrolase activator NlpD